MHCEVPEGDKKGSYPHRIDRLHRSGNTQNIDHALQVICEHLQAHLGAHVDQPAREESFLRIDPDEFRAKVPGYDGANSWLVQPAASLLVEAILDCAFKQKQTFLLDGSLSSQTVAERNVQRAVDKGRSVQIIYVYQDPTLAWAFVRAREMLKGRRIPPDRFVHQFFESRKVVEQLKVKFGKAIKVDVILKDIDGAKGKFHGNVSDLASVAPLRHSEEDVRRLVTLPEGG